MQIVCFKFIKFNTVHIKTVLFAKTFFTSIQQKNKNVRVYVIWNRNS